MTTQEQEREAGVVPREWLGRLEHRNDEVTAESLSRLALTLDRESSEFHPGSPVPPLWHWIFFSPRVRHRELDAHGLPRQRFCPEGSPLAFCECTGGSVRFDLPLRVGDEVTRSSRIIDVRARHSAERVRVRVRHEIFSALGMAISEEQELRYPPHLAAAELAPRDAPSSDEFGRNMVADPLLLFRYAALTFNGYRLHYDRTFAAEQGTGGLPVQCPLLAILLLEMLNEHAGGLTGVRSIQYSMSSQLLHGDRVRLCGRRSAGGYGLWIRSDGGKLLMQAQVQLG